MLNKRVPFQLLLFVAFVASVVLTLEVRHRAAQALPLPTVPAAVAAPVAAPTRTHTPWKPQIAFQFYETKGIDPAFLAEHVDWLMMRYGAEQLRDQIVSEGYRNVLPQYLQLFQIYGPGPYDQEGDRCKNQYMPVQNNVMWTKDFCEKVHGHESWFLHNGDGERLYVKERNWDGSPLYEYYMNPASDGFRAFWIDQIKAQRDAKWQAFFLDNVAASYGYLRTRADNEDGTIKEFASDKQWQQAVVGMLRAIRTAFPDHEVWGNIIESPPTADAWDAYRDALDGMQEENFATNWVGQPALAPKAWAAMIERAEGALAAGKSVVLYGQGEQNDFPRMRFSLASYLLVATPDTRTTFRYAYTSQYETLWWYPDYEMDLGMPQGSRRQEGSQWVRDFACAKVTVNPAQQRGTIKRHPCIDS